MEAMCSSRRADPLLPPGFRFHPTDEELIDYLIKKVNNNSFCIRAIGDVDLNKNEPWDLPEKAKMGEKEWYFFTLRDRKYPTGMRTNRATEAGYWKATGKDRDIIRTGTQSFVGAKKTLVFYRGRAPKGTKTNWIMHEYRLEGEAAYLHNSRNSKDSEWVVCRIFQKSPGGKKGYKETHRNECEYSDHSSLPPLLESPHPDSSATADSGISFPMLKHIPAEFGSIRFPWSYEQPLYDVENIPTTSRNIRASCKMEPSYNLDQQQQQQQNIYNFDVSSKRESNWLNDAYSLANPLQDQGLTEILGLPGSGSAVDLESLWTY